jgi:hypothetical protein
MPEGIDDAITGLRGTATGDGQLAARFIHDAARNVLFLQPQVMITGPVIAPRVASPRDIAQQHRRFAIHAHTFDVI